jgi:hypothetical protein
MEWIDPAALKKRLCDEASRDAARLGHRITGWVTVPGSAGRLMARCVLCREAATVCVRVFRAQPIAGVAVEMPCRPRKRLT